MGRLSSSIPRRPFLIPVLAFLFAAPDVFAAAPESVSVRSRSGQFIVHGRPNTVSFGSSASGATYLRLDPTLTAISLERVRQAVLSELALPDRVRTPIHVRTEAFEGEPPPARMDRVHFNDGWGYRLALPERMDKVQFIAVATEVLLLEMANRTAVLREAELPPWLAVGLASELSATLLPMLALEPGAEVAERGRYPDPMRVVRETLRERPALKFDDLCMPTADQIAGDGLALYRACAHLFVHELCRLRGGRDCLREMLLHLPENLNWQTTFLQYFAQHFQRLIDVDKWYALSTVNLTGRDPMSLWPRDTTARQLDDVLTTQVQVRLSANELPMPATVPLQRILGEWDFARQQPLLAQKVNHLQALRLRAASEYLELVDEYLQVLQSFLAGGETRNAGVGRRLAGRARVDAKTVIKRLNELDARRNALRDQLSSRPTSR